MTASDPDVDGFIDALRSDLPSEEHERRIRARLVAAGVVAGTSVTLPGAAAAASGAAKAGLLPKLAVLSWGAKLGLAGAVIAVAALPIAHRLSKPERGSAPSSAVATSDGVARAAPLETELEHRHEPAAPTASAAALASSPRSRSTPQVAPPDSTQPVDQGTGLPRPSVGSLPPIEAPVAAFREARQSTLREEAELMARALAALRSGDRVTARHWLAEHARRFPDGQLRRERDRARERANDTSDKSRGFGPR